MIREFAEVNAKNKKAHLDLLNVDTEMIYAFGNELSILRLMIKYSKDVGYGKITYWTKFNKIIAEDLSITEHTIVKHLKLFMSFGIIHRVSLGNYGFNEKFIKIK